MRRKKGMWQFNSYGGAGKIPGTDEDEA